MLIRVVRCGRDKRKHFLLPKTLSILVQGSKKVLNRETRQVQRRITNLCPELCLQILNTYRKHDCYEESQNVGKDCHNIEA